MEDRWGLRHYTVFMRDKLDVIKRACVYILFLLLIEGTLAGALSIAIASEPPFDVGEKLTYQLKWGAIPAGEVNLEVLPNEIIDGKVGRHFRMTAKTNSFVDVFYRVRDKVDGYTDLPITRSLHYQKKQREGSRKRDIVVKFDWQGNTAQYYNFNKERPVISIDEGAFDPFSVLYYCRLFDFRENRDLVRSVTDGKKIIKGVARFKGRESIEINGTHYDTFLIEPDLEHISGVFKKSKNAKIQIWFTDDDRRIPVRVKSKVVVGSFVAELIDMKI